MLINKFIKGKPSVESADVPPAVVDAVQQDVVAQVDDATAPVEAPAVVETPPVVDEVAPAESELPEPNTAAVAAADDAAHPVVAAPGELTVSVEETEDKDDEVKPTESEDKPATTDEEKPAETEAPAEAEEVPATTEEPAVVADDAPASTDAETPVAEAEAEPAPATADDQVAEEPAPAPEADPAPAEEPATTEEPAPTEATEPAAEPVAEAETTEQSDAPVEAEAPEATSTDEAPADVDAPADTEDTTNADVPAESDVPAEEPSAAEVEEVAEVEAEVNPENTEKLVQEAEKADDAYADEMLELNGLQEQEEDLRVSIEQLQQHIAALENFQEALSEAQAAEEPISPEIAGLMGEAVADQTDGFVENSPVPSMESFQGRSGSRGAIVASLEGIGENIATFWKWVRAAISKLITLGGKIWRRLMDDSARILSRVENLQDVVDQLEVRQIKASDKVVVPPTLYSRLSIGGRPVSKTLPEELERIEQFTSDIVVNFDNDLLARAKAFSDALNQIDLTDLDGTVPTFPGISIPRNIQAEGSDEGDALLFYSNKAPLLNDGKITVAVPSLEISKAGGFKLWQARAYCGVSVAAYGVTITVTPDGKVHEMPVLGTDAMTDVLASAEKIAKISRKFRSQSENVERYKQTFLSAGDSFTARNAGKESDAEKVAVKRIVSILNDYAKDIGTGSSQMVAFALRSVDASLRYVSLCVDWHHSNKAE